jgi:hypothetical protein
MEGENHYKTVTIEDFDFRLEVGTVKTLASQNMRELLEQHSLQPCGTHKIFSRWRR